MSSQSAQLRFHSRRSEFKARLLGDFVPYGGSGLSGKVELKDATGSRQVFVQIYNVPPQMKTRFRADEAVVVKGTIKRFQASNGTLLFVRFFAHKTLGFVYRLVIDSEKDVEFLGEIAKFFGQAESNNRPSGSGHYTAPAQGQPRAHVPVASSSSADCSSSSSLPASENMGPPLRLWST